VLDGGGSHTVVRYAGRSPDEAPPDELAVGSAFLKPTLFDDALLEPARPAVFLAMPILKRVTTPSIPFLEGAWPLLVKYDPNLAVGFYLYGGPWDGEIVWPPGLRNAPFHEEKIHNLLPNQELLSGSVHVPATEGDYVFVRPQEGDGIAVFTRILAVRDGKVEKVWAPMPTLN
ncbi:MAG: hypothetical protein JST92_24955, partial [Deltaproteobacteria bacterium]|nr:hypothetical protein [Deltaproteobacteria bacterium]